MDMNLGWPIIEEKDLDNDIYDVPGVWALFGKRKDVISGMWFCLQVGQTNCIKSEIKKDKYLLEHELNKSETKSRYINQFGEVVFSYPRYYSAREQLYSHYIKERFEDFYFALICEEIDPRNRKEIERKFAYRTNAVYWRNGGTFKSGKEIDLNNRENITFDIQYNADTSKKIMEIIQK